LGRRTACLVSSGRGLEMPPLRRHFSFEAFGVPRFVVPGGERPF
jgi:hypothetical protein